jgi:hypothetical protein
MGTFSPVLGVRRSHEQWVFRARLVQLIHGIESPWLGDGRHVLGFAGRRRL